MKSWRKSVLLGAVAAIATMVTPAVAHAYETIPYGTDHAGCERAEKQAKAAGYRYADCFQTGPGYYSLALDD